MLSRQSSSNIFHACIVLFLVVLCKPSLNLAQGDTWTKKADMPTPRGGLTEYSYIAGSFKSLIDHIMITTSVDSAYPNIKTKILKVDETFTLYLSEVSDHRPVASKIPVF